MLEVREYVDRFGRSPFADWFDRLDPVTTARVSAVLVRMGQGNLGSVRTVGGGVMERRVSFGPGYRIYFGRDGATLVILLLGGTKRRQHADIRRARALWQEYRLRKELES